MLKRIDPATRRSEVLEEVIILNKPRFTIGRNMGNDLVLTNCVISREHCILMEDRKNVWSIEVVSTNGLQINRASFAKGSITNLNCEDRITLAEDETYLFACLLCPKHNAKSSNNENAGVEKKAVENAIQKFKEEEAEKIRKLEEDYQSKINRLEMSLEALRQENTNLIAKNHSLEQQHILNVAEAHGLKQELKEKNRLIAKQMTTLNSLETAKGVLEQHNTAQSTENLRLKEQLRDIEKHIEEILENEVQCAICLETLISPVVVDCGHPFCRECIDKWRTKNVTNCPTCRTPIQNVSPCGTLGTVIERLVQETGDEYKRKRSEVLSERGSKKNCKKVYSAKRKKRNNGEVLLVVPEPQAFIDLTTTPN